jgi:hypothetical protein
MRSLALFLLALSLLGTPLLAQETQETNDSSGSSGSAADGAADSGGREQPPPVPEEPGSVKTPEERAAPAVPSETDIRLPNMLLQVREVELDTVAAALPDSPPVELPDISGPLPADGDDAEATASIQLPDPGGPGFTAETREQEASLFSRGVLGIGTMNHIIGSLSLYRLGVDPRLRFEFDHEGYDGYQFQQPGDGFFHQANSLTGSVEASFPRWELSTEAGFNEVEEGMQDNPNYYSVKRRELSGGVRSQYRAADRLTLQGELDGGATQRIFAVREAETSRRQEEVGLSSTLGAELSFQRFTGIFDLTYQLTALDGGVGHLLGPELSAEMSFPNSLFLSAGAGVAWNFGSYVRGPFSLEVSGTVLDTLTLTLRGGYEVAPFDMSEQWEEELLSGLPAPGESSAPTPIERFYGELTGSWKIVGDALTLDTGVEAEYALNGLDIGTFDTGESVYPLVREERIGIAPRLTLNWRQGVLQLSGGWQGELQEAPIWEPDQLYTVSLELSEVAERFGGSVTGEMPVYGAEALMPRLTATSHVDLADGIRLVAEAHDLLAPIMDDGRPRLGPSVTENYPFIEPGFRFIIKTELSL